MKKSILAISIALTGLLATTGLAFAQGAGAADAGTFYIGPQLGIGFLNNNYGTQFVIGAQGGYKLSPNIGVGLYYTYTSLSTPTLAPGITIPGYSASMNLLLATGDYYFAGMGDYLSPLRLGIRTGLGFTSLSVPGASSSNTNFAIGPAAGYDIPVWGPITVGPEVNVIWITTSGNATDIVNLLAVGKWWF